MTAWRASSFAFLKAVVPADAAALGRGAASRQRDRTSGPRLRVLGRAAKTAAVLPIVLPPFIALAGPMRASEIALADGARFRPEIRAYREILAYVHVLFQARQRGITIRPSGSANRRKRPRAAHDANVARGPAKWPTKREAPALCRIRKTPWGALRSA